MTVRPEVVIADDMVVVEPGLQASTTVSIRNTGDQLARYTVSVVEHSLAAPFVWFDDPEDPAFTNEVRIFEDAVKTIRINFSPPNDVATPAGVLPYAVRVDPVEGIDQGTAVEEADLSVGAIHALEVRLRPRASRGRFRGKHRLEVTNRGSDPIKVAVDGTDDEDDTRLQFAFSEAHDRLNIPGGGTADAFFNVRADKMLPIGKPVEQAFRVLYRRRAEKRATVGASPTTGGEVELDVPGSYTQKPVISKWMIVASVLGVAIGAAVFMYRQATAPEELSEPLRAPEVAQSLRQDGAELSLVMNVSDQGSVGGEIVVERLADCSATDVLSAVGTEAIPPVAIERTGQIPVTIAGEFDDGDEFCFRSRTQMQGGGDASIWVTEGLATFAGAESDAPTNLRASAPDPATILFEWDPPSSLPEGEVTYQLRINGQDQEPTSLLRDAVPIDDDMRIEGEIEADVLVLLDGDPASARSETLLVPDVVALSETAPGGGDGDPVLPQPQGVWIEVTNGISASEVADSTITTLEVASKRSSASFDLAKATVGEDILIPSSWEAAQFLKEEELMLWSGGFASVANARAECQLYVDSFVADIDLGSLRSVYAFCAVYNGGDFIEKVEPSVAVEPADEG